MSDIVNLRHFKKQIQRKLKEKQATKNRIFFGMTKQESQKIKHQKHKNKLFLINNKLEKNNDDVLT